MPEKDDPNARYAEIIKRIEQRKRQETSAPIQSLLSVALDGLNAAGLLAAIKRRPPPDMSAYGPKTFSGSVGNSSPSPIPEQWVATIMWHKPKGYQYYQTLRLLGIWALGTGNSTRLLIGEKRLMYNAAIFNPESYYHHIKRKFDIYYSGNAAPPLQPSDGSILFDALYNEPERLKTRNALRDVLRDWVTIYKPDPEDN